MEPSNEIYTYSLQILDLTSTKELSYTHGRSLTGLSLRWGVTCKITKQLLWLQSDACRSTFKVFY